jgi:transcriptional regulator with XRE-family HTH domain
VAPNERLRESLHSAGLDYEDIAGRLDVDPKTVERWVTMGRVPYPRHRRQLALMSGQAESYLWPNALSDSARNRVAESELVQLYPHRSSVPTDVWSQLFERASEQIDVLVYAGLFLPEQHPRLVNSLCDKAVAGTRVRLLLGDPKSEAVARRGQEEGIGASMAAKIENVLSFYRPHALHTCMDVRLHATTLYNSLYRFDGDLLVNQHVYGVPAAHAPVAHLRQLSGGDLFSIYTQSFQRVWDEAVPAWRSDEVA